MHAMNFRFLLICLIVMMTAACSGRKAVIGNNSSVDLKVMSYNVHHCNPPAKPGIIDLDAIAAVINTAKPDIVGLQEIDVRTNRSGKEINQAEQLAKKTSMHFFFAKAIDHDGGEYGIAILSKFPINDPKIYRLSNVPDVKGEPRILLTAKLRLNKVKEIRFANTHLDAGKDPIVRMAQIREINAIGLNEKLPMIIAGDFNARPNSEVIQLMDQVFERTCLDCPPTIPSVNPRNTIDFIGFRSSESIVVRRHEVIDAAEPSDHLPVMATLKIQ